jgi:hypothetical protein
MRSGIGKTLMPKTIDSARPRTRERYLAEAVQMVTIYAAKAVRKLNH